MKKILSVLLAVISIFTLTGPAYTAFAQDIEETVITDTETPETSETSEAFEESEASKIPDERVKVHKKTLSVNENYDKLLEQFTVRKSECGMKYAYYSPVADKNDTTKYPLVIYVHGRFHGWTDKSFIKSGLAYWCSTEIQEQFEAGGAHLLMPKLSEFMLFIHTVRIRL